MLTERFIFNKIKSIVNQVKHHKITANQANGKIRNILKRNPDTDCMGEFINIHPKRYYLKRLKHTYKQRLKQLQKLPDTTLQFNYHTFKYELPNAFAFSDLLSSLKEDINIKK